VPQIADEEVYTISLHTPSEHDEPRRHGRRRCRVNDDAAWRHSQVPGDLFLSALQRDGVLLAARPRCCARYRATRNASATPQR